MYYWRSAVAFNFTIRALEDEANATARLCRERGAHLVSDEEVLGLDVAVDDVLRVAVGQRLGQLQDVLCMRAWVDAVHVQAQKEDQMPHPASTTWN